MTIKRLDIAKFTTKIKKSIPGISTGFHDPKTWISTGSFLLNKLISGDFNRGIPLGKSTIFAGESGSGKSLFCTGNVTKNALDQGIKVFIIDTENAIDASWLENFGIDPEHENLTKVSMSMVDDVAKLISEFIKDYKATYDGVPMEEREKFLFIIDSLGMLMTPTDVAQFEAGELKGDMGRKPKALKALVTNLTNMFGENEIGLLCTNHTYASQDMYNPDPKVSGGAGPIFAASIVVVLQKRKLKEDENGVKISDVTGIRSAVHVEKSRYAKPFEKCELHIPYETGMSPYTGMFDYLYEKTNVLKRVGNRYQYIDNSGVEHTYFRKDIPNSLYDLIMSEWDSRQKPKAQPTSDLETIDPETGEIL